MEIREANLRDLDGLYELWIKLMAFHQEHHPVFELAAVAKEHIFQLLKVKIQDPNTTVFICRDDDRVVGMLIASYTVGSEAFVLNKKGYIAETIIEEGYRGTGIGKELFRRAENYLIAQGADHIALQVSVQNNAAKHFWKGQDFKESTYNMIKKLKK